MTTATLSHPINAQARPAPTRSLTVVKVGGAAGIDLDAFCADAASLIRAGTPIVIVHGGSHQTNLLSEALGHPPQFITSPSGHTSRRTDRRTLEIFQMACRGVLNQQIVERLQRSGVNAIGLSGMDGQTWLARRKPHVRAVADGRTVVIRDDFTGTVEHVNTQLLQQLLDAGLTPVLSPPAISTDQAREPLNVDADRAAAITAAALRAEQLLLLSNVPGLLRAYPDESSVIPRITPSELTFAAEIAQGRMKKKILSAEEALAGGVARITLADARVSAPVSLALAGRGTVIENPQGQA